MQDFSKRLQGWRKQLMAARDIKVRRLAMLRPTPRQRLIAAAGMTFLSVLAIVAVLRLPSGSPSEVLGANNVETTGTVIATAHITAYGYFDNTPAGYAISYPLLHDTAGGKGSYDDPITVAVGHSIVSGKDTLDYAAGMKFYIPYLQRYFIVEDTCGDGPSPQDGPCHSGLPAGATTWIDVWAGGGPGDSPELLKACQAKITDGHGANAHTIILNPDANRPVVTGPLFQHGKCTKLY